MKQNNAELLGFANSFADISGAILKKNYFKNFRIEQKSDGTLVTDIDKLIESKFRNLIKKNFPIMELSVKSSKIIKIKMNMCGLLIRLTEHTAL